MTVPPFTPPMLAAGVLLQASKLVALRLGRLAPDEPAWAVSITGLFRLIDAGGDAGQQAEQVRRVMTLAATVTGDLGMLLEPADLQQAWRTAMAARDAAAGVTGPDGSLLVMSCELLLQEIERALVAPEVLA